VSSEKECAIEIEIVSEALWLRRQVGATVGLRHGGGLGIRVLRVPILLPLDTCCDPGNGQILTTTDIPLLPHLLCRVGWEKFFSSSLVPHAENHLEYLCIHYESWGLMGSACP